ncbi:MAG: hypothetical protein N2B02_02430 [Amylibacter sp.]
MSFDLTTLTNAIEAHGQVARILIANHKGSSPRESGTSMLVWEDGFTGTIGGGALEYQAVGLAQKKNAEQMLNKRETHTAWSQSGPMLRWLGNIGYGILFKDKPAASE